MIEVDDIPLFVFWCFALPNDIDSISIVDHPSSFAAGSAVDP